MTYRDLISFFIVIMAITFFLLSGFVFLVEGFRFSQVGEGTHVGYITAVDERGYIWKNYDVYFKTDTESSQEDEYCVSRDNPGLAKELEKISSSRQKVKINYHGVRAIGWGLCESGQ